MSVLLDTGFLYAFINRKDPQHDDAQEIMASVAHQRYGAPFVADLVVSELFTLVRARTSDPRAEEAARRLLLPPAPLLPQATVLDVGRENMNDVWRIFAQYRDARVSFVDAAQIHLLGRHGLSGLVTFDRRLAGLAPNLID